MTQKIDFSEITLGADPETVTVAEFRNRARHLTGMVRADYHACVGDREIANWGERTRRIAAELINTTCKRAKLADWNYRETAIDIAATKINHVVSGGRVESEAISAADRAALKIVRG